MASPVRDAIYEHLAADVALTALLSAPDAIWFQVAPQEATFPVVVFHRQSGTPRWTFAGSPVQSDLWAVKGISESAATAENIAAAIDSALQDAALTVAGRDLILRPLRESDIDYAENVDGVGTYRHSGALYRVLTA